MLPSISMVTIYSVENKRGEVGMEYVYVYIYYIYIVYTESKGTSLHRTMNTLGISMWNSSVNNTLHLKNTLFAKHFYFYHFI